jgi:uncharacterized membrane protein
MMLEQESVTDRTVRTPSVYRDPLTWVIAATVFCAYTTLSVFRLLQLNPTSFDLSVFTDEVKQYAHFHLPVADVKGPGFNLLGDHFSPIVAVLAPFFRVFPSPATLLVAQTLLAAASIFPVSQLAREKLGPGPARVIALVYGFSWGLQQMINFDFHEIAFAVPLLAFSLFAAVRGRIPAAVWWALPLVFVKEDQGFTVAAIGVYLRMSAVRDGGVDRARVRAGLFLMVWGLGWSILAIAVIIPHFNPEHQYSYWAQGGALAPGQGVSPLSVIRQFCYAWPVKLETVVLLLLPTAFIAVRSPLALIAVPSVVLRFESSDNVYWGTSWHYNATVMPILFIAAVDALARIAAVRAGEQAGPGPEPADVLQGWWRADVLQGWWRSAMAEAERHGTAMMLAIAVPLAFQFPLSGLWNGQTYEISPEVTAGDAAMAKVPDGATVTTLLGMLAPLAARADVFWMSNSDNPATQYIVFDSNLTGTSNVPAYIAQYCPGHHYTQIFDEDKVYVFRLDAEPGR